MLTATVFFEEQVLTATVEQGVMGLRGEKGDKGDQGIQGPVYDDTSLRADLQGQLGDIDSILNAINGEP